MYWLHVIKKCSIDVFVSPNIEEEAQIRIDFYFVQFTFHYILPGSTTFYWMAVFFFFVFFFLQVS